MTDKEVFILLKRIDDGYKPTEIEKQEISGIDNITWKGVDKIPESIYILTDLKVLDVSGGFLHISNIKTVPESIGNLTNLQYLDLSNTHISNLPDNIVNLTSLQSLNLGSTRISTLPESIGNLTSLQSLDLRSTHILTLPGSIGNLSDLKRLDLSNTQISMLPERIWELTSLKHLDLSSTQISTLPHSIGNLLYLQGLYLRDTNISSLPDSIVNLKDLQHLDLRSTQINTLPYRIGNLLNLQGLYLSDTQIRKLPDSIGNLTDLQDLCLSNTQISTFPDRIVDLSGLQYLDLSSTQINTLPDSIVNLSGLQHLDLSSTQISTLPDSIVNLSGLQHLDLRSTQINKLPDSIGDLTNLKLLILEDLTLYELPESLLSLDLEYKDGEYNPWNEAPGIYIRGLRLYNQPIEIFSQSRELIVDYYKSIKKGNSTSPINECKVVFLGDGGAGKSLIIDRLMNDGNISDDFNGESTPGICISSKKYSIGNEVIELHFWDFGGQAIMHSMHRLFLTNRTLYVVVTNARDNKANEQAWYWIRNVKSFANGAPILLLVNQKDQNPSADVNKNGLRKEYPYIRDVRIMSALKDTKEEFLSTVSNSICRIVSKMDNVHTPFSNSWLALMNDLQDMPDDVIKSQEFYEKCENHDVGTENEQLDQIISWYQDLGVCFYSRKHPTSKQYMVLKPRWLLNALYILIFNGRDYAVNGIIKENDIYELICRKVSDKNIKLVYSDITYKEEQIQYILTVLLNYELIFRLDEERFFIPMLCDENEPNSLGVFGLKDARQISFEYAYLPENVLHKLMVRHGYDLNTKVVWRKGAMFYNGRCGWTALVRMKDNCLDVFARSSHPDTHPVNVYLDLMRESIYKINESFGISAQEFITYRKGDKTDRFEYEILRGNLEIGNHITYSKVLGGVGIEEILGVVNGQDRLRGQGTDSQINALLNALSGILLKLQENSDYYSAKENSCNTYVRDLLEQCGYICYDQTLRSLSGTGKSAGSLDILILDKDSGKKLSIYEAQKLKGFGTADQEYLDDHLKRLLDNYNAEGLQDRKSVV